MIRDGRAYVDDLSADEIREYRGTLKQPGRESPHRNRSAEENLDLFRRMRAGEFPDGSRVLRAKIDMASPNINMRDPVLYRIRRAQHHRTGDAWCIYPMYDYAHPISDALERITHSICTLEFEDHRPLYDWLVQNLPLPGRPQQIEFARLNLTYTVMSKRKLLQLVTEKHVSGWDDPRMPTISGLRRRGFTPEAIRRFCDEIGVAKRENVVDVGLLEFCVREDLNARAPRVMAVLRPLRVVIENYPEDLVEEMDVVNNPEDPAAGTRKVPFSRVLYIEQDDFMLDPPKKFFRLAPGREVRLRNAYLVTCTDVVKDASGAVVELRCTYDPGDARRRRARWPKGQGHAALGVGRARDRRGSPAVRPAVHGGVAGQRRHGLPDAAEPAVARSAARVQARAVARGRSRRDAIPVRAARLFLRRSGLEARRAGLQSDRDVEGQLGENQRTTVTSLRRLWRLRLGKLHVRGIVMRTIIILAAIVAISAGCGGRLMSPTLPATFTVKPGQTAAAQGVSVTFRQVVSDSRCPTNAVCVWAGEATVTFTVRGRGSEAEYELRLGPDTTKRSVTHKDVVLEFEALQPHPVAGQTTDPASYRATIELR